MFPRHVPRVINGIREQRKQTTLKCHGIHGSVLSWFKPYLSTRCFRVKCETDLSSWHTSSCGVPQGSVLGPLLFIMYTTPLRTLISSCSLNHHLYADDTQLFLSFLPTHLDSCIDHLHDDLDRISSWMTANLLTLNSSKTEFLLIGLSKQLAKNQQLLTHCLPILLSISAFTSCSLLLVVVPCCRLISHAGL